MIEYKHFYGVDISKKTVDLVYTDKQITVHQKFTNNPSGMDQLMGWLRQNNTSSEHTLFCLEATGYIA